MPKGLQNHSIELEVDPNPNGLPVLFMHFFSGARLKSSILLDEESAKLLVEELKAKIAQMESLR